MLVLLLLAFGQIAFADDFLGHAPGPWSSLSSSDETNQGMNANCFPEKARSVALVPSHIYMTEALDSCMLRRSPLIFAKFGIYDARGGTEACSLM